MKQQQRTKRLKDNEIDALIGELFTKHRDGAIFSLNAMGSVYIEAKSAIKSQQDPEQAVKRSIEKWRDR